MRLEPLPHELDEHVLLPRAVHEQAGQAVVLARERVVVVDAVPVLDRGRPPEEVHRRHRPADERPDLVPDGDVLEAGGTGHRMITVIVDTRSFSPSWFV